MLLVGSLLGPIVIVTYLYEFWIAVLITFVVIFGFIFVDGLTIKLHCVDVDDKKP